jgi:transposase-like protein
MEQRRYSPDFKVQVVLESYQRDTTPEAVCQRFDVPLAQLHRWRQEFQERAPQLFRAERHSDSKRANEPGKITHNHLLWQWFFNLLNEISWR